MQVNVHQAKTQLSKLIEAALRGEEVVIARGDVPVVRLEAVPQHTGKFKFAVIPELVGTTAPDFLYHPGEDDMKDGE